MHRWYNPGVVTSHLISPEASSDTWTFYPVSTCVGIQSSESWQMTAKSSSIEFCVLENSTCLHRVAIGGEELSLKRLCS
eukprot:749908-Hanusia_phi.AAC.5